MIGNPNDWDDGQWEQAFRYFEWYYDQPGELDPIFAEQPVELAEFKSATLTDYADAMAGQTTHPLFGTIAPRPFWEMASVERESIRDRLLIARDRKPVGFMPDGSWPDSRFDPARKGRVYPLEG